MLYDLGLWQQPVLNSHHIIDYQATDMGTVVNCRMVSCCLLSDRDGPAEGALMTFGKKPKVWPLLENRVLNFSQVLSSRIDLRLNLLNSGFIIKGRMQWYDHSGG